MRARPARLVGMLVIFGHAFAFVSQVMSNYGAQPSLTASMWDQPPARTPLLHDPFKYAWGYVWHTPSPDERPTPRGLGNGISWGFEPSFCDAILPTIREHSPAYASGVTCDDLKAATRRAFSAWSLNHDAITWYERHPPAHCPTVFNLTAKEGVRDAMKRCNAGMLPVDLAGECVWTGGCPLTEVLIGARNDNGMCTYGDGANECGPTPARDDGYYAERLPNRSRLAGVATSSSLQFGMWDACQAQGWIDGTSETCKLPPLRAPNGFEQYLADGTPVANIETYGSLISLNRDDCFYLDATFCGGALASAAESSAKARRRPLKHSPPHIQMLFPASTPCTSAPTSSSPLRLCVQGGVSRVLRLHRGAAARGRAHLGPRSPGCCFSPHKKHRNRGKVPPRVESPPLSTVWTKPVGAHGAGSARRRGARPKHRRATVGNGILRQWLRVPLPAAR